MANKPRTPEQKAKHATYMREYRKAHASAEQRKKDAEKKRIYRAKKKTGQPTNTPTKKRKTKERTPEQKAKHAAYMREYRKKKKESGGNYYWVTVAADPANSNPREFVNGYDGYTIAELRHAISERRSEAKGNTDDSESMTKIFRWGIFTNKKVADLYLEEMDNRGYNFEPYYLKMNNEQYSNIAYGNTWTKKEFLRMVATIIDNMANADVEFFVRDATEYCKLKGYNYMI